MVELSLLKLVLILFSIYHNRAMTQNIRERRGSNPVANIPSKFEVFVIINEGVFAVVLLLVGAPEILNHCLASGQIPRCYSESFL